MKAKRWLSALLALTVLLPFADSSVTSTVDAAGTTGSGSGIEQ